jgi:hypothetical protein
MTPEDHKKLIEDLTLGIYKLIEACTIGLLVGWFFLPIEPTTSAWEAIIAAFWTVGLLVTAYQVRGTHRPDKPKPTQQALELSLVFWVGGITVLIKSWFLHTLRASGN